MEVRTQLLNNELAEIFRQISKLHERETAIKVELNAENTKILTKNLKEMQGKVFECISRDGTDYIQITSWREGERLYTIYYNSLEESRGGHVATRNRDADISIYSNEDYSKLQIVNKIMGMYIYDKIEEFPPEEFNKLWKSFSNLEEVIGGRK